MTDKNIDSNNGETQDSKNENGAGIWRTMREENRKESGKQKRLCGE